MQPIGDYLKKLLYHYDCIVVPTLGAFLTHSVSASFHEATGQFLPPRRKVAFNEALMLDDGILLNYVMLHEGITREEALRAVNGFVSTLKQDVQLMGSYSVDGLGLFSYNSENSLQFEPELRHNFLGSAYGMQPVMLASKIVHLAQPVAIARPLPVVQVRQLPEVASVSTSAVDTTGGMDEGQVLIMPVRRSVYVWRWAAAALLVGSLGFVSYFSVTHPGEPLQSSLNPAALLQVPAFLVDKPAEKAVIPVVASKAVVQQVDPVTSSIATGASPRLPVEETNVAASATHVPASSVLAEATQRINFTVIAGSFASRTNALRFQKRLVKAGYSDAYIVQGRGLIKVAAIGSGSLTEAEAGLDSLQSFTGITPWIMRNQ